MTPGKPGIKVLLSTLWIVVSVNYIFCDVFSLMYSEDLKRIMTGRVGDIVIDQKFLLTFAIIMEIPMIMILLSRILKYKINRALNIIASIILTIIQAGSLLAGVPTLHYVFFSIVEITITVSIFIIALKWVNQTNLQTGTA